MYAVYDLNATLSETGPICRAASDVTGPIQFERGKDGYFPSIPRICDTSVLELRGEAKTLTFTDIKSAQLFAAAIGGGIVGTVASLHDDHAVFFAGVVREMVEDIKINALDEFDDGAQVFDVVFDGARGYNNAVIVVVNNPKTCEVFDVIYSICDENHWTEKPDYYYEFEDSRVNELLTGEFYADEIADELDEDFDDEEVEFEEYEEDEGEDEDDGFVVTDYTAEVMGGTEPYIVTGEAPYVTTTEPTPVTPAQPQPYAITDDQKEALERITQSILTQFSNGVAEILARVTSK